MSAADSSLEDGRSILDDVGDQAGSLRNGLGTEDREKLDEYLTSVRELEQRMSKMRSGPKSPSPKSMWNPPKDIPNAADLIGRTRLLFDLAHLAIQTDSTRLITIMLAGSALRRRSQASRWGIMTCRIMARIQTSWNSSRSWNWRP